MARPAKLSRLRSAQVDFHIGLQLGIGIPVIRHHIQVRQFRRPVKSQTIGYQTIGQIHRIPHVSAHDVPGRGVTSSAPHDMDGHEEHHHHPLPSAHTVYARCHVAPPIPSLIRRPYYTIQDVKSNGIRQGA